MSRLAAGVDGTKASIAVQLDISVSGGVADGDDMQRQLRNATAALARANAKLGIKATIGTVMVDQEGWGSGASPATVTKNNDIVYTSAAAIFGKDVNIQYYGRGMATGNDKSPGGFWEPAWYTMDEIDNRQLSVSLYVVPEKSTMRRNYERTVEKMLNVSARCKQAAALVGGGERWW